MSSLNELYGPANGLPSSPAKHLNDVADSIVSLPLGERAPNVRIWGNPGAKYILIQSFHMQEIHWQGMTNVEAIDFYDSQLDRFPSFTGMTRLTHLGMTRYRFTNIPDLSNLVNLTSLYLDQGALETIDGLSALVNLQELNIWNNPLKSLPSIDALVNLATLSVHSNALTALPELNALVNLTHLDAQKNHLTALPELTGLEKLSHVDVQNNRLGTQAIDAILVQLASTNTPENGQLNYSGNPGAPDEKRSTAASTAY